MSVSRFEDLEAWQQARQLTNQIYATTRRPGFARDFGLSRQIQRAAVSAMSNIAEGFERSRPAEFHQALSIAKASAAEVRSLLYVALDTGYVSDEEFQTLSAQADRVGQVIGGLRRAVQRRLTADAAATPRVIKRSTQSEARSTQHVSPLPQHPARSTQPEARSTQHVSPLPQHAARSTQHES